MDIRLSLLLYILTFFMFAGCLQPNIPHTAHQGYIGEDEYYAEQQCQMRAAANAHWRNRNQSKKQKMMDPEEPISGVTSN
eukprot:5258345-Ditylum_brightwellii.AAC.1